jgi:tuftelin-interacting protein 11
MLRGMGWEEGQGLGREGHGMVQPVAVELRTARAGLGAETPARSDDPQSAAALRAGKMLDRMRRMPQPADPDVDMFKE